MKNKDTRDKQYITLPDLGKIPPQAIDVESAVLGAIMVDSSCIDDVAEILTTEMFYKEAHKIIYQAALTLYKLNKYADITTITSHLRDISELESVGGPVYITGLTRDIISTRQISQHALIVKTAFIQREMIRIGTELQNRGFDSTIDPADLLEYAEKELYKLGDITSQKEPVIIGTLLNSLAVKISEREKSESELIGVPSGITELDRVTMGWQKGDLTILASRPSMGKSALAVQFGRFAAQLGHPTLLFSLEMTDIQLGERYLSSETGHDTYDMKRGRNIQWEKIETALRLNSKTPLWIDDSAHMSIYEFRSKVRRAKKRHNIELVICDYLNLFTGDEEKDNMSEIYGSISKMFKRVAKECSVAVIALAQLNRNPDMRANQFPKLSDLRNSGEIEQDADIVIFPVRYKLIGKTENDKGEDISSIARIDIAKNRNGRLGIVEVKVGEDCMQWGIMDESEFKIKDFTESQEIPY